MNDIGCELHHSQDVISNSDGSMTRLSRVIGYDVALRKILVQHFGSGIALRLLPSLSITGQKPMYGLIGKIIIKPGQRDALVSILLAATQSMPGCLSYILAADPGDAEGLWITEIWDSAESHTASLRLPAVEAALTAGRPLIVGFGEKFVTSPLGGFGTRLF